MARPLIPTRTAPHHMIPRVGNVPHEPSMGEHLLHSTKDSNQRHQSHVGITTHAQPPHPQSHGQSPPRTNQRMHPPHLHAHTCHQWCLLQQSDRLVPHHLQLGQHIRCLILHLRLQLHSLDTLQTPVALQGFKPLLHKMNNETSHTVENFIQSQQNCLQYTLLDMHCTNPTECTIRTWKNHFLAGIAGLPKSFPITNWCCLTKQCYATLNILSPFCQNPLLSAHEALAGSFSFNATPLAPLGTEVLVCMKPN